MRKTTKGHRKTAQRKARQRANRERKVRERMAPPQLDAGDFVLLGPGLALGAMEMMQARERSERDE